MKRIVLVFAFLVAIAPTKGQTTNTQTNCQVIGNQIICNSQTQTTAIPLVASELRKDIPAPPTAQQLQQLAIESNRVAAEAMRRDVERFTAELSSHDAWVSIKSGNSYHVRMSGDHIYIFRIVPPGANWSQNMECAPAASPGTWDCASYLNASRFSEPQMFRRNQTCSFETHMTLNFVSLDRITGEADNFSSKNVDWGKCKVKKVDCNASAFTWVPRGANLQQ